MFFKKNLKKIQYFYQNFQKKSIPFQNFKITYHIFTTIFHFYHIFSNFKKIIYEKKCGGAHKKQIFQKKIKISKFFKKIQKFQSLFSKISKIFQRFSMILHKISKNDHIFTTFSTFFLWRKCGDHTKTVNSKHWYPSK